MASVTAYIRTTKKKADKVHLRFRLRTGRALQLFHKGEIEVPAAAWDGVRQEIKANAVFDTAERLRINREVVERKNLLLEIFDAFSGDVAPTSEWLENRSTADSTPKNTPRKRSNRKLFLRHSRSFCSVANTPIGE